MYRNYDRKMQLSLPLLDESDTEEDEDDVHDIE
jgi:hypothetical protein